MKKIIVIIFLLLLFGCEASKNKYFIELEPLAAVAIKEEGLISSAKATTEQLLALTPEIFDPKKARKVKANIYQQLVDETSNNFISVSFYTWLLLEDQPQLVDVTHFNNEEMQHGSEIARFYSDLWQRYEKFYLSYQDLHLSAEFLTAGAEGKIYPEAISIGMGESEVIAILGPPIITDWFAGGKFYYYNDIACIFDEKMNVAALQMPGYRIKHTLDEVSEILGSPSTISYSEMDHMLTYSYEQSNYVLSFEGETEQQLVSTIWLHRK